MIVFAQTGGKPVSAAEKVRASSDKTPEPVRIRDRDPQDRRKNFHKRASRANVIRLGENGVDINLLRQAFKPDDFIKGTDLSNLVEDTTPKRIGIGRVRALYDFLSDQENELAFRKFDEFFLLEKPETLLWWKGRTDSAEGYFPASYVEIIEEYQISIPSPAVQILLPGSSMVGLFKIENQISNGIHGSVFVGSHLKTRESVCISQIPLQNLNNKEVRAITTEIDRLKSLNHPGLLAYQGAIKTQENFNMIFDYIPGEVTLKSVIEKFGAVSPQLTLSYLRDILETLDVIHKKDLVHRAIRSDNIFLTKAGTLRLGEFGFAGRDSAMNPLTHPYWMAPEELLMKPLTSAIDIWSVGCLIIELLTGNPPYHNFDPINASLTIVEQGFSSFPSGLSPYILSILKKCFAKEAYCRPSAKELLNHSAFQVGIVIEENIDSDDTTSEKTNSECPTMDGSEEEIEEDVPSESSVSQNSELSNLTPEEKNILESARELLTWFTSGMDKASPTRVMRIRKHVRNSLKNLQKSENDAYKGLIKEFRTALARCQDEMGEHIPVDSYDDFSSDVSFSDEFEDEDDPW